MTTQKRTGEQKKGDGFAAGALTGTGVTFLIMKLLEAKPVAGAEIDLSSIEQALGLLLTQNDAMNGKLDTLGGKLDLLNGTLLDILTAIQNIKLQTTPGIPREPVQIFSQTIRVATLVGQPLLSEYVDFRTGSRLLIKAESTLDQLVNVQLVGDYNQTQSFRSVNINGPFPCPAGGNLAIGLAWDDWHPYVAAQITVPVAPTVGDLRIYAVIKDMD